MELTSITIDGREVKRGDYVGFKSDVEQSGQVVDIWEDNMRGAMLRLYREYGFEGHYIGGQTTTVVAAKDCWTD